MATAGHLAYHIECVPSTTAGAKTVMNVNQNPCGIVNGTQLWPATVQVYAIDPAAASYLDGVATPFDYVQAGVIFWSFFTPVVALYLVAKNIGAVLKAVREF